jgi:type II secretory pathway pseudopilin PulG
MIELIFVIVIIGILAAVAIPKLAGVQDQAHASKAGEFVGQLNSIIMPNLYSKSVVAGSPSADKAIKNDGLTKAEFEALIEIPKNFVVVADVGAAMAVATSTGTGATPIMSNSTNNINIFCRDGNETDLPRCWYSAKTTAAAGDFNVTKSSF